MGLHHQYTYCTYQCSSYSEQGYSITNGMKYSLII